MSGMSWVILIESGLKQCRLQAKDTNPFLKIQYGLQCKLRHLHWLSVSLTGRFPAQPTDAGSGPQIAAYQPIRLCLWVLWTGRNVAPASEERKEKQIQMESVQLSQLELCTYPRNCIRAESFENRPTTSCWWRENLWLTICNFCRASQNLNLAAVQPSSPLLPPLLYLLLLERTFPLIVMDLEGSNPPVMGLCTVRW